MTGPTRRVPQRRAADRGPAARAWAWWRLNAQIVLGPIVLLIGVGLMMLALNYRSTQQATARAAKEQCERTVVLGPKLADYYARDAAFPRDVLAFYRRTIPKSCPK